MITKNNNGRKQTNNNIKNRKDNRVSLVALYGYTYLILIISLVLIIDYDRSKLVNGQLEAVGAVLSVVPVTSILATAGLVGVKLAALSRLLQVLGYDQAYLASGGSGTAAQPIGLQTNYAYMFPYVPGLNISVKGEHGTNYQNPAAQQPGYSTTRKTFPAMGLPGDYESQSSPFRGAETLREIFRDSGINIRFPSTQQHRPMFNSPKGNGHNNINNNNNLNQMNNNIQQILATTPLHHDFHPNQNDNNNNHMVSPPPPPSPPSPPMHLQPPPNEPTNQMNAQHHNSIPIESVTDNNGANQSNSHNVFVKPVNVIADPHNHDQQAAAHSQPSTLNSQPIQGQQGQSQQPQSHPVIHSPEPDRHQADHNHPSQLESQHRQQNNQVNMPHPSHIRPINIHHNSPAPNKAEFPTPSLPVMIGAASTIMPPNAVATTTPLFETITPPPIGQESKKQNNEQPMTMNHRPSEHHHRVHSIPQRGVFTYKPEQQQHREQQQKQPALLSGQLVTVPAAPSSRPPNSFDDFVRTYFGGPTDSSRPPPAVHFSMGPLSTTTENARPINAVGQEQQQQQQQPPPSSGSALPTGTITTSNDAPTLPTTISSDSNNNGPSPSDVTLTTNIIPSSFATDGVPPPFHDDMENNEINLGNRRRRRRRKRDLNVKTSTAKTAASFSAGHHQKQPGSGAPGAASPPPMSFSDMLMSRSHSSGTKTAELTPSVQTLSSPTSSSLPSSGDHQHQQQQQHPHHHQEHSNGSGQNDNFGMPALNIYPTLRKRRSLKEKILYVFKERRLHKR